MSGRLKEAKKLRESKIRSRLVSIKKGTAINPWESGSTKKGNKNQTKIIGKIERKRQRKTTRSKRGRADAHEMEENHSYTEHRRRNRTIRAEKEMWKKVGAMTKARYS